MNNHRIECDTLVVGAGPGGIAAAVMLADHGRSVVLVDDNPRAGGQIWRNRGDALKSKDARAWLSRLTDSVTRLTQSRIVARLGDDVMLTETPNGPRQIAFRQLVLATGARELFLPFPGWTLPGVMGAGALQALIKSGMPVAGKRVLISGTGPLLLAVADLARANGAKVPMIVEQTSTAKLYRFAATLVRTPFRLIAAAGMRARLARSKYITGAWVTRAQAHDGGLRVTVGSQTIDCDYLACGYNLIPNNELPTLLGCRLDGDGFVVVDENLQTSVGNVFAVGELTGIGGAEKAILEGQIAACAIVGDAAGVRQLAPRLAGQRAFAKRLQQAFAPRREVFELAEPETIVCRCEDVARKTIDQCSNLREARLQARCGMGPCQGRICGPALRHLLNAGPEPARPPVFPASIETLASVDNSG